MPRDSSVKLALKSTETRIALTFGILALLLRLPNLGWGLPDIEDEALPFKKAIEMGGWATGKLSLDPHTAGWPPLSFYIHLVTQGVLYMVGRVLGLYRDRLDFYIAYLVAPNRLVLAARMLGTLSVGVIVFIACRIAHRLCGVWPSVLVGLALALDPLLLKHSQLITPDILMAAFSALAVDRILSVYERGSRSDYLLSGLWIGLGAATKYSPFLLLPSLYVAHWLSARRDSSRNRSSGLTDRRFLLGLGTAFGVFALTSITLFRDLDLLVRDFKYQTFHLTEGHFGQESHSLGYLFYLNRVLLPGMGLPAFFFSLIGLTWFAVTRRGLWLILAICVLSFLGVAGALSTHFDRYMLPVVMPLTLGAAAFFVLVEHALRRHGAGITRVATVLLFVLIAIPGVWTTMQYHRYQSLPSTFRLAKQYFAQHLASRTVFVALEHYTLEFPDPSELKRPDIWNRLSAGPKAALALNPRGELLRIPLYSIQPEDSGVFYDLRHYLLCDYLVISSDVRDRYLRAPDHFPDQIRFYRNLATYATLETRLSPGKGVRGPEISIYRFDREGKTRLEADEDPLTPAFARRYARPRNVKPYVSFFLTLAQWAYRQKQPALIDLYYQALYETTEGNQELDILGYLAQLRLVLGRVSDAEQLYREYLARRPNDPVANANFGHILDTRGDADSAAIFYRRCLQQDRTDRFGWVRARLDQISR